MGGSVAERESSFPDIAARGDISHLALLAAARRVAETVATCVAFGTQSP